MADKKVSAFNVVTDIRDADLIPLVRPSESDPNKNSIISGSNLKSNLQYPTATNYGALPPAGDHASEIYVVLNGSGVYIVNRKSAGMYYSDGATWARLGNIPAYFSDVNFKVYDSLDNTKQVALEVGGITTGTTRTLTPQDKSYTIADKADLDTHTGDATIHFLENPNWDTAFSWGDHALVGYLDGFTVGNSTFVSIQNVGTAISPDITATLSATGSADATTFLRGDNTWNAVADQSLNTNNDVEFKKVTVTDSGDSVMEMTSTTTGMTSQFIAGAEFDLKASKTAGTTIMDFEAKPLDGTSEAQYRFGLSSGSTGANKIIMFDPNSANIQCQIASSGTVTFFCLQGGDFVIGGNSPLNGAKFSVIGDMVIQDSIMSDSSTDATSATTGAIKTAGGISCEKSMYVGATMSAQTVIDRTPYPESVQLSYEAVNSMERLPDGVYQKDDKEHQLDHSKLHNYLKAGSDLKSRDMSATISVQNEVIKDLIKRIEKLEGKL